ncbi:MAG: histone deacetylase [Solirubrobacterales bacterium]
MLYFSHPACLEHDPSAQLPGHPDVPARLVEIERLLSERDWRGCERREAPAATEAELRLVHSERQVRTVAELAEAGGGAIDADTYVGEASYRAALHAAGGAGAMARALLGGEDTAGFCAMRPAGHHAEPDRSMGFCLFNNVAIAAELAVRELGAERVLVFDWDVHHGNGTVEAFRHRDDVLVAGIHQAGIYPGSGPIGDAGSGPGTGYTINLPVPAGSEEAVWLSLVEHIVVPVAGSFDPDLVLIAAGFDGHRTDPLGGCRLDTASFAKMACFLRDAAAAAGAPIGAVLEGGYEPLALAESVAATVAALGGEGETVSAAPEPILTSRAAAHVAPHWEL